MIINIDCPLTLRCMAVQVDQVSGVGTVIKTGDYVDMVVGLTADKFPVITVAPGDKRDHRRRRPQQHQRQAPAPGPAGHGHAAPAAAGRDRGSDPPVASGAPHRRPAGPGTTLNGQQEIVILAVTAQQAEVLKFAQMDGNVTLALRAAGRLRRPAHRRRCPRSPPSTTGVTLKVLVDSYGVLPPEVVQTVTPTATNEP